MKEIKVDENTCIGCGACIACAQNNFDFDNERGISVVISNENVDSEEVSADIDSCPVGAITIEENASSTNENEQQIAA